MNDDQRLMYTIFCDDIRQEMGNKLSIMGVYGGQLLVPQMPFVLPKLCIVMHARTLREHPFRQLRFRVLKDDELLTEQEIPEETLVAATKEPKRMLGESEYITFAVTAQLIPIVINSPFLLRSRAITEAGELKGGSLSIELSPPNDQSAAK